MNSSICIKKKYIELKEYLESNEDFMNEAAYRNFTSEQFAKKLMGQIVFLYFIQKKRLAWSRSNPCDIDGKAV